MSQRSENARKRERGFTPLHYFFVIFVLVAGSMFCYKLFAFLSTIKRDELAGFAYDPIITYGFVAMGFLCLLMWAYASGQFRDIERPKHDMLERFHAQERAEARILGELPRGVEDPTNGSADEAQEQAR